MKITLFVFFITFLAVKCQRKVDVEAELAIIMDNKHKCQKEIGVTDEMIAAANKGNFPADKEFKCYLKCMYEQENMIKADNTIDLDKLVDFLPTALKPIWSDIIYKCGTIVGDDLCDTATKTTWCYYQHDPVHFHIV